MRQLQMLKRAGLDEIRFHTWSSKPLELALRAGLVAGVEIPAIPGNLGELCISSKSSITWAPNL
jgi:pyruvate formate-lyase activating enzyme-like uncharacterized protein